MSLRLPSTSVDQSPYSGDFVVFDSEANEHSPVGRVTLHLRKDDEVNHFRVWVEPLHDRDNDPGFVMFDGDTFSFECRGNRITKVTIRGYGKSDPQDGYYVATTTYTAFHSRGANA